MPEQNEPKRDYYQEVTNEIIAAMEKGNLPWQKPWDPEVGGNLCPKPFNGKSGRAYTVENAVRLLINMGEKNSSDPRYFTFNQAKEKGWSVKKGAKALCVRQGFYVTKDIAGNDLPEEEHHWTNKYINVFHASDICSQAEYVKDENGKQVYEDVLDENGKPVMVDDLDKNGKLKHLEIAYDDMGYPILNENGKAIMRPTQKVKQMPKVIYTPIPEYVPKETSKYTHEETMELAEAVLQNSGAKFSHISGDRAFYEKNSDTITMPPKEAFPTLEGYYATALHELAHWTGHESRLKRNLNGDKSSPSYAKEELRAELASVFLSMELGVPVNTTQNAAYIQSWVENLKEDKKEIFNAANDAMKITSYIKELAKEKIKEITLNKKGKSEEPEIKVVSEAKEEKAQEIPTQGVVAEPQNKSQEEKDNEVLKQNGIDVVEPREVKQTPEIVNEPTAQKPMEQPEPQPTCLVVSVYNPKDGEFGKEFDYNSKGKFKLNDFERQPADIILDANSPEEYFAKHNAHAVGSLVQVDDELFYMNNDNKFKRVYGAFVNGEVVLAPAANPSKFTEQIIGKIGQEEFNNYKQNFTEIFRNGAAVENLAPDLNNLDMAYSRFVYDNAVKYGLSSNNPIATKQWDNANKAFMKTCAKELGADAVTMDFAAKAVKGACPVAVDTEALKNAATKFNNFQKTNANENKNVQVAAYGVR